MSYTPSGSEGNGSVKTSGLTSSILKEAPETRAKQGPQGTVSSSTYLRT